MELWQIGPSTTVADTGPAELSVLCERCIHSCVYRRDIDNVPLLHLVCGAGRDDLLTLLLKTVPRLEVNTWWRKNISVERNWARSDGERRIFIMDPLVSDQKANPEDAGGITPLHLAVATRNKECAHLLLKHGAKVNALGGFDESALHHSCAVGDEYLTKLLLGRGAWVNLRNCIEDMPLHVALMNGQEKCVDLLLKHGADPNAPSNSEVISEVPGKLSRFYFKPRKGCTCGDRPLHYAVAYPSVHSVKSLIKANGDVNLQGNDGRSVFASAVAGGSVEVLELLAMTGCADSIDVPDRSGARLLHLALKQRHVDVVQWLLDHGVNPNAENKLNMTPVVSAIHDTDCSVECIKLLLKHSGKVNAQCYSRYGDELSLLHIAISQCRSDVASLLIYYGASVNAVDYEVFHEQQTPLMLVPFDSWLETEFSACLATVRVLAHAPDIDLDVRNEFGETGLHVYARAEDSTKSADLVEVLLDAGAEPTALNNSAMSPADVTPHADVKQLIQSYVGMKLC